MLFSKPFNINNSTFIYIDEDDSADSVFAKIELNLHPKSMTGIKFLSRIKGYEKRIYTGAYKIDAGTTTFANPCQTDSTKCKDNGQTCIKNQ